MEHGKYTQKRKIVYVDMDNVLCDFDGSDRLKNHKHSIIGPPEMYEEGFFRDLKPTKGSLSAIRKLLSMGCRVEILTQPVKDSIYSYNEKVEWILKWFPELVGNINLTQDKTLFIGDYLIDDNPKWSKFTGEFLLFDYQNPQQAWDSVTKHISEQIKETQCHK